MSSTPPITAVPHSRRAGVLAAVLLALVGGLFCGSPAPGAPIPNAADVRFLTPQAVLWAGHTAVLPLRLKAPAPAESTYTVAVADSTLLELLSTPVFLAGETTGYMRVRALHTGRTRLEIHGGPAIVIDVKEDPADAAVANVDPEAQRPRIVSPMPGAAVWGEFTVGVEVFESPPTPQLHDWFSAGKPSVPPPAPLQVQLQLPDGRLLEAATQTAPESGPRRAYQFIVDAGALPAGPLRLVAVAGRDGASPVHQRAALKGPVFESAPLAVTVAPAKPDGFWAGECENPALFGLYKQLLAPGRPSYFGTKQPVIGNDANASGGKTLEINGADPAWCLPFNVQTPGDYQLLIKARGSLAGGAFPTAALYLNELEVPAGLVRLAGAKYQRLPIGTPVHLDAGPQMLTVQFKNDFYLGKEDRNLYLDAYELARIDPPAPPTAPKPAGNIANAPAPATGAHGAELAVLPLATPPQLTVLYPANGAEVFGVDAVVVKATAGSARLGAIDVTIDGQPQNVSLPAPSKDADVLIFPLLVRGIEPGTHRFGVRAAPASGQPAVAAPEQIFRVLAQAPPARGKYERAVWLLDRLAFGPEPQALAAILTQGEARWLSAQLNATFDEPAEQAVLARACEHYRKEDDRGQTVARALNQWIDSDNPVRSRFTAWAENHFSTWINKTRPAAKWREHLTFASLGIAPFGDLLAASAHSPAMLLYLDQEKSYAGKLNENYAREIMELHTLGVHGGYRQEDVTALAGVLNGWSAAAEANLPEADPALQLVSDQRGGEAGLTSEFRFVPVLNDGQPHRVLGLQFPAADATQRYDRIRLALEMLASHPSTAEHVCRKLAEHYVGVPAPAALVRHLAGVFLAGGGDMRAVLYAMAGDPEFWSAPPKIATPFDYSLRAARLSRAAALQAGGKPAAAAGPKPDQVEAFLQRSGMGLFDRVTPDGYPENNGAYADSNALLQRWRFMQAQGDLLTPLVPVAWRKPPVPPAAANLNPAGAAASDPGQRFIDLAAVRLTGRLLSPSSNRAALDALGAAQPADLRQALVFVSLLPETNLR